METVILIVICLLILALIGKSLEIIQKLIEFFKRDDIRNLTIGGGVITVAIGIFFGNIGFFISLILFIGMLCSEWMKSSSSFLNETSSKSGFIPSLSETFHKFKNDINSDREERKSKSREIQERKAARYEALKPKQTKSSSTGNFSKEFKEKPMKQKWVVMIKLGKGSNTWVKGPTFDDFNKAQWYASNKEKSGSPARVEPA
jgi:hypothetical protein|tara:strand:- start:107 stop:712 length:606 start_codon:yes stop_codon:yes gene_type:complete